MTLLIAGLFCFIGVHSIAMIAPGWRKRSIARIGGLHLWLIGVSPLGVG